MVYLDRVHHFRNMQALDPNFMRQKERVLWPLYTFKKNVGFGDPVELEDPEQALKKIGKNAKLFHGLKSVQDIKSLQPLKNGKRDAVMPLKGPKKNRSEILSEEGGTDEEEDAKKDFFESMVYWQQEQERKKGTKKLAEAQEEKARRQKMA